ncbi:glycosyltransferase [Halioglobus maricola]|uniref:Glycosyltransferase n=1 Tax=Halioglobus maricola TaxID=2601894 RepID=A0A5P9NFY2_9GAMM|nr:glycosyltransferase family 4 protein [Halioglobus maricola]QFU74691.1 glycosyltransferase [Halioglobus maricola]
MASLPSRPSILLITRNFPPLTGGMERLLHQAAEGLDDWAELSIIGPNGCSAYAPPGCEVREAPHSLAGFMLLSFWHVLMTCRRGRFQLILGGSGLAAPALWLARYLCGAHGAIFVHGLDIVVNNWAYQRLFLPAVRSADLVIANSANTRRLAIERGVAPEHITVINPGTELPLLTELETPANFREHHGVEFDQIILFVGRMTRRKGLSQFIEKSLPAILDAVPGAGLVVIGDDPVNSLNKLGEQDDVLAAVDKAGLEQKVRFLGAVEDSELLAGYTAADVQIFPLVEVTGDVEGFGMVAIEAAACGTPTVAFDCGGVSDAITTDNGTLVTADDYEKFSTIVIELLKGSSPTPDSCRSHAEKYAWPHFHQKLATALQGCVSAFTR